VGPLVRDLVHDGPGLRSGRLRGDWIDPEHAGVLFGNYAEQWLQDRVLKVRTAELYRGLLRNHLLPAFRDVRLSEIDEAAVRRWRKERLDTGSRAQRTFGPVTVAKAYRLLHAIFETAVDDQMVRRNPCRIEGAAKEDSPEREIVSLPVVFAIADALPMRYRAMALLATFASMRWGELAGLRRENIDLDACEIRIVETAAELDRGDLLPGTPKSRAGRRTVTTCSGPGELGLHVGAGEGNRTLMTSLEGWGSAIELRPRHPRLAPGELQRQQGRHG
jgi:integrase